MLEPLDASDATGSRPRATPCVTKSLNVWRFTRAASHVWINRRDQDPRREYAPWVGDRPYEMQLGAIYHCRVCGIALPVGAAAIEDLAREDTGPVFDWRDCPRVDCHDLQACAEPWDCLLPGPRR